MDEEQEEQIERVQGCIGSLVKSFIQEQFDDDRQFYIGELIEFVSKATQSAPTSPDRMLRKLRKDGYCNYRVVNRRKSLYEITSVSDEGALAV